MRTCETPDLTRDMDQPDNQDSVGSPVATARAVESQLPEGWVPEDVFVRVWARENDGYGWETLIPEFSIAGMGKSVDAALENAIELLDDYLLLCARDGMSFNQARRPLPTREMARLVAGFSLGRVVRRLGQGRSGRRRLDVPLHSLNAH